MKKNLVYLCALAAMSSCTAVLDDVQIPQPGFSIPVRMEKLQDSKSYLNDYESDWDYVWENGDKVNFIVTKNGRLVSYGAGSIRLTGDMTLMELGNNYTAGQVLYSWFAPDKTSSNTSAAPMEIPAEQVSDYSQSNFTNQQDIALTMSEPSLDKTTTSSESLINSNSMTPAITILTFKIDSYQPDKEYYCKVGNKVAAKLSPKGDGTVSVSVNFPAITFGKAQKATGSTFTTVTLYCSESDKTAASIVVKVNGSKEKSGARYKYQMSYSLEAAVAGTQKAMVTTSGNMTATPVHDAMPIVATPLTITKYMIDHSSPENSLSFNMLGSAVKWKIYGESSKHTVGEVIKSVSFTSNGQAICGTFNYNMTRNDFVISGLSGKTVTSHVDELGMVIGNGLDNYKPVHMILAPGTFSGNIVVTTDKANYYASVKELTYKRAILKSLSVNLDGSNVTRVPFEPEVDPEPEPDPTPSADIDDWTVNNDGYEF